MGNYVDHYSPVLLFCISWNHQPSENLNLMFTRGMKRTPDCNGLIGKNSLRHTTSLQRRFNVRRHIDVELTLCACRDIMQHLNGSLTSHSKANIRSFFYFSIIFTVPYVQKNFFFKPVNRTNYRNHGMLSLFIWASKSLNFSSNL